MSWDPMITYNVAKKNTFSSKTLYLKDVHKLTLHVFKVFFKRGSLKTDKSDAWVILWKIQSFSQLK